MRDLREFFDPDLHLPIDGHIYTVKSPDAELGLRIKRQTINPDPERQHIDEINLIADILGATYDPETDTMSGGLWDEMTSNGLSLEEAMHVGNTALAHYGVSPEFGEYWWENRLGKEHEPLVPEAAAEWAVAREQAQEAAKKKPRRRKKTTS